MATTQYIGARYVPIIGRRGESSAVWDNSAPYEPLTVVTYQGNSYVSRQAVPAGIAITNTDYWIAIANYNAQLEQYRQETAQVANSLGALASALPDTDFNASNTVSDVINSVEAELDSRIDTLEAVLPASDFDSVNTVKAAIDAVSGGSVADIEAALPIAQFDSTNTVKAAIDAVDAIADANADDIAAIKAVLPFASYSSASTIADAIARVADSLPISQFNSGNTVKDAIDALSANNTGWITSSYAKGWYMRRNGIVYVNVESYGDIEAPNGTFRTLFTLPVGFRPLLPENVDEISYQISPAGADKTVVLHVLPDGKVEVSCFGSTSAYYDGLISFPV